MVGKVKMDYFVSVWWEFKYFLSFLHLSHKGYSQLLNFILEYILKRL